jgi:hypothetical protein
MKRTVFLISLIFFFVLSFSQAKKDPPRLKRADSFFGVHFDFHAGPDCNEIGKDVDQAMVEYVIDQIKPDFLQIDCKGHPGYSSYPTKVGNPAPGFVKDPLKIWREVTAAKGVALYMHYSGVWDARAVQLHPQWAAIGADNKASDHITSVFGSYADSLLIPQFKELSAVYGVDGVWVDGDCWATQVDYSPAAISLFTQKTGLTDIPLKAGEKNWHEYLGFCRQAFKDYVTKYTNELHRFNPDFQVASNWAFSSFMPEPVSIPVDFISGDFWALNSMNSARIECRFIRNQGKPWDLMAWGFSWIGGEDGSMSVKSVPQIQRELATVLSLGGGVQVYMSQKRDGSIYKWTIPLLAEASKFARARQPFCQNAKPVPQVGLVLSGFALYNKVDKPFIVFDPELVPLRGILNCLLASQKVVDVVGEHQLDNINDYPLIIYPEWDTISSSFKNKLLTYVSNGGKLLIIGPKAARQFADVLQVDFIGAPSMSDNGLEFHQWLGNMQSLAQQVVVKGDARPYGKYYQHWDMEKPSNIASSITHYGKGEIAAIYLNIGAAYWNRTTTVVRDFLNGLVSELNPDFISSVEGSHLVDVTLNKLQHRTVLHLVNASGSHENEKVMVHDEIPALGPLKISLRYPMKPKKVTLQPENIEVPYIFKDGKISCSIPKLEIHEMIVVE